MNSEARRNEEVSQKSNANPVDLPSDRQMNEKALFIFHKSSGMAMYSHYFLHNAVDPQLLAGFVGAMASFLSELVGFERTHWKTIYGTDTTLIVEAGEWSVAVLAVSRETIGLRGQLRIILSEFEAVFGALSDSYGFDAGILESFNDFAMRVFSEDRITPNSFARRSPGWDRILSDFEYAGELHEMSEFLSVIGNGRSLASISDVLRKPFREIKEMASIAAWDGAIEIDYIPSEIDVLVPSERSLGIVFSDAGSVRISASTTSIIGSLDGRSTVGELTGQLNDNLKQTVLAELGSLKRLGYIQDVAPEHRLVIDQERVVNSYLNESRKLAPDAFSSGELQRIFRNGLPHHPWLSRIQITLQGGVQCLFDSTMTNLDFEAMFDALQYLVNSISTRNSARVGENRANAALFKARVTAKRSQ